MAKLGEPEPHSPFRLLIPFGSLAVTHYGNVSIGVILWVLTASMMQFVATWFLGIYCARHLGNSPTLPHPPASPWSPNWSSLGPLMLPGNLEGVTPVDQCGWDARGVFANNSNYLGRWFQLGFLHTPLRPIVQILSGLSIIVPQLCSDQCSTRSWGELIPSWGAFMNWR